MANNGDDPGVLSLDRLGKTQRRLGIAKAPTDEGADDISEIPRANASNGDYGLTAVVAMKNAGGESGQPMPPYPFERPAVGCVGPTPIHPQ